MRCAPLAGARRFRGFFLRLAHSAPAKPPQEGAACTPPPPALPGPAAGGRPAPSRPSPCGLPLATRLPRPGDEPAPGRRGRGRRGQEARHSRGPSRRRAGRPAGTHEEHRLVRAPRADVRPRPRHSARGEVLHRELRRLLRRVPRRVAVVRLARVRERREPGRWEQLLTRFTADAADRCDDKSVWGSQHPVGWGSACRAWTRVPSSTCGVGGHVPAPSTARPAGLPSPSLTVPGRRGGTGCRLRCRHSQNRGLGCPCHLQSELCRGPLPRPGTCPRLVTCSLVTLAQSLSTAARPGAQRPHGCRRPKRGCR